MARKLVGVETIIERLRVGLEAKNASDLAAKLGITPGAITNWRSSGKVGHETVVEAARKAGLSLSWVFDGVGPMRLEPSPKPLVPIPPGARIEGGSDRVYSGPDDIAMLLEVQRLRELQDAQDKIIDHLLEVVSHRESS